MILHPCKKVAAMGRHGRRVAEVVRHQAAAVPAARGPKRAAKAKVEAMVVAAKVDAGLNAIVGTTLRIGRPSAVSELLHEKSLGARSVPWDCHFVALPMTSVGALLAA